MHPFVRILGIFMVFLLVSAGWVVLGGVTSSRSDAQRDALDGQVADLWGIPQAQSAPTFQLEWDTTVRREERVTDPRTQLVSVVEKLEVVRQSAPVEPARTRVDVGLSLDQRRKGLLWYPLYDVDFAGEWTYTHPTVEAGGAPRDLRLQYRFPHEMGLYDAFRFVVDGVDRAAELRPESGLVAWMVRVQPGQTVTLAVSYASRGMREWTYLPTNGVGRVDDFALTMRTDFADIDYPRLTISPTTRERTDDGWVLTWRSERLVSGFGVGMVMPERVQPGELAAGMAFSAPLSLGLFFLWIYALGLLRGKEIHPVNYLFLGGAFFAFNLLFAYTADHLPIEVAFALASVVSVLLVVTYLRLVVGSRFAFVEAGIAQLLYQIGFAAAHFQDGMTGLTITVLGVVTLFALMQLTGRIKWGDVLSRQPATA